MIPQPSGSFVSSDYLFGLHVPIFVLICGLSRASQARWLGFIGFCFTDRANLEELK
jgi:hypothetical protein